MTRPEWITEAAWRALRTAWQVFIGTALVAAYNVVTAYGNGGAFDWQALWRQGVVLGIASVIAWWMNRDAE